MNYKDTIIKTIKWEHSIKNTDDGKADINIHIPLSKALDLQAKTSFARGAIEAFTYLAEMGKTKTKITTTLLYAKFKEWGIPFPIAPKDGE